MSPSPVAQIPTAPSAEALEHFARRLSLETDCADVHEAMTRAGGAPADFVLLDVRGPKAYARSHVPGAINLPHREITAERMAAWPEEWDWPGFVDGQWICADRLVVGLACV